MAKRMGAKIVEVKASHLSLIAQPEEITRSILAKPPDSRPDAQGLGRPVKAARKPALTHRKGAKELSETF